MSVSVRRQHQVMEDAIRAIMGAGTPPTMSIGSTYASIVFPQGYTVPDETTLTNKYNELLALEADRGFLHVSGNMVVTSNLEVGEANLFVDTTTGKIGVGTTTPSYSLDIDGTLQTSGDVIAFSDKRKKKNIEPITNALEKVLQLQGVTFNKLDDDNRRHAGIIAQEVEKVLPEVVYTDEFGMKSVAYGNMIGLLIEAIKELKPQ
jgi:hypothetical protein